MGETNKDDAHHQMGILIIPKLWVSQHTHTHTRIGTTKLWVEELSFFHGLLGPKRLNFFFLGPKKKATTSLLFYFRVLEKQNEKKVIVVLFPGPSVVFGPFRRGPGDGLLLLVRWNALGRLLGLRVLRHRLQVVGGVCHLLVCPSPEQRGTTRRVFVIYIYMYIARNLFSRLVQRDTQHLLSLFFCFNPYPFFKIGSKGNQDFVSSLFCCCFSPYPFCYNFFMVPLFQGWFKGKPLQWLDGIHFAPRNETMESHRLLVFAGGIIRSGFLRGCRISSIRSRYP